MVHNAENTKELMFACGFTSRATFYRNFSEKHGVSPPPFNEMELLQVSKSFMKKLKEKYPCI
nr:hypothetical protein [Bacteroides caecimuris]